MFKILADTEGTSMQNVYTPLTLPVHLGFCVLATVLYLVQYYRKGSMHYVFLMFAIDATLITQFWTSVLARTLLGITEIVLIGLTVFYHYKFYKKQKAELAEQVAERREAEEKAKAAEDAAEKANADIVGSAFDD